MDLNASGALSLLTSCTRTPHKTLSKAFLGGATGSLGGTGEVLVRQVGLSQQPALTALGDKEKGS